MKISRRIGVGILILMMVIALFFMTTRYENYKTQVVPTTSSNFPPFPPTMLQNTIPLKDVTDVVNAFKWLNGVMENGSSILAHDALVPWAELYLTRGQSIIRFNTDANIALNLAMQHEYNPIYMMWWTSGISWYIITMPEGFKSVYKSGGISILKFDSVHGGF